MQELMQNNNFRTLPIKRSAARPFVVLASSLFMLACFAGESLALPSLGFGKAKDADAEDAPDLVPKIKLTKEQQTEFDTSFKNGNEYLKQSNFELAQFCFMRCTTLNPSSAFAHLGLARCYIGLRRSEPAQSELFESLKNDPTNAPARFALGEVMMAEQRWDEAGGQFFQVLKHAPDDLGARGNLAVCLQMLNQVDSAVGQFKYIIEKDPKNVTANYNLAACYELRGNYDEAAVYYKRVVELDKKNTNAYASLAKCLMAKKNFKDAQVLLDHAKTINPQSYFLALMQGYLYETQDERRKAIESYTRAVQLNPGDADSKTSLQRMLEGGGSSGGKIQRNTSGLKQLGSRGGGSLTVH